MFTAVIGGGAAGLMAAAAAAASGSEVTLLEKNEKLGKKIYITGKGRCNVTNSCDFETFIRNVVRNPRFMYSSVSSFGPEDLKAYIEENGTRLKVERGNRVFPVSDHASDITKALFHACEKAGVSVMLDSEVKSVQKTDDGFLLEILSKGRMHKMKADRVIVCTGGLSYPSTGSTGDGYRFASENGLTVKACAPSLVSVITKEDTAALAGVSLINTGLAVYPMKEEKRGRQVFSDIGELVFTHHGISGPMVLTASAVLSGKISAETPFVFSVDLKPGLTDEQLDRRILRDLSEKPNMNTVNALSGLLISGIREEVCGRAGIPDALKAHDLTKAQRNLLVQVIKRFEFTAVSTGGFEEAVITNGGVDVKELNPATMESKKVPGLYFAGEVVDVDAMTGGFNLQCAFSMGRAAGKSAAEGSI